jgi:hypothetical protein
VSAHIDELSPSYIGEDRIDVALDRDAVATANTSMVVTVDYSRCAPAGATLPLELIVQGPSAESYQRRVFTRLLPSQVVVKPIEGGPHLIVLREVAHNRWWGRLRVQVDGERLAKESLY